MLMDTVSRALKLRPPKESYPDVPIEDLIYAQQIVDGEIVVPELGTGCTKKAYALPSGLWVLKTSYLDEHEKAVKAEAELYKLYSHPNYCLAKTYLFRRKYTIQERAWQLLVHAKPRLTYAEHKRLSLKMTFLRQNGFSDFHDFNWGIRKDRSFIFIDFSNHYDKEECHGPWTLSESPEEGEA